MKLKINESDIRNFVAEAVESVLNEPQMFFLVDETDGAVLGNYDDKNEAIKDAKEKAGINKLGRYLVVDRNDTVYYDSNPGVTWKI